MNWQTDISFCPDMGELSAKAIVSLIGQNILAANDTVFRSFLEKRYEKMVRLFPDTPHVNQQWEQRIDGYVCSNKRDDAKPDARLVVPTQYIASTDARVSALCNEPNLGVDLPTWFCNKNVSDKGRVMLVSQDPLRVGDRCGSLYLSSPWAFHSSDFRKKERKQIPQLLVNNLLEQGYRVYLTDASKLFAHDHAFSERHIIQDEMFKEVFRRVLFKEAELFKPNVIVAVGKIAAQILMNETIDNWEDVTIPEPTVNNVSVDGTEYKCLVSYHYSRLTSRKRDLEKHYRFIDNMGNRNYMQYYMRAIEKAVC